MRAVIASDGQPVLADQPDPEPARGEVLVRVRSAGINRADLQQAQGHYPPPPGTPRPDVLGLELAGEVVALGPGTRGRFGPGDRVMALVPAGAQAELAAVDERLLMAVPAKLDLASAGAVPEVFTTAHDALFTQAGLQPGEHLLVHGAAGGVGTAALQLGRAAGASVTATVRNAGHRGAIAQFGAQVIAPERFTDAGPFDVVLELIGAPNLPGDLHVLAPDGRIVVIGVAAGAHAEVDLLELMVKRGRILASTLRARPPELKAAAARALERDVLPLFDRGEVQVPIAASYPLEHAAEAYARFAAGSKLGKIVLTLDR